jgi:hypothetical protein
MTDMRIAFIAILGLTALGFAACSSFSSDDGEGSPDASSVDANAPLEGAAPDSGLPGDAGDAATAVDKYSAAVLADAPLAYWRMAISSGLTIPDATGHGHALFLQGGGFTLGVPGAIADGGGDDAIRFDGINGSAAADDSRPFDFPNDAPFTIECWARYEALDGGGGSFPTLFSSVSGAASSANGYTLYISKIGSSVQFNYGNAQTVTGPAIVDSAWRHYAASFDGTVSRLFVDGQMVSKPTDAGITTRTSVFTVAGRSGGSEYFPGSIDEVAVYDKALTLAQIIAHIEAR